jgi:2-amino-4-hydroxy-6-hydroxymethyldihydropteridine diphosphokinase
MNTAYLLTGSNLGESASQLTLANQYISQKCGKIITQSAVYQTAPWGNQDQPFFLNQAIKLATELEPEALMQELLHIETLMGRIRTIKYGPRVIDLDILFFNDLIINKPMLQLPHPAMAERRFVLVPMAEIAPTQVHPVYNKTIQNLLIDCRDSSDVQKKIS